MPGLSLIPSRTYPSVEPFRAAPQTVLSRGDGVSAKQPHRRGSAIRLRI